MSRIRNTAKKKELKMMEFPKSESNFINEAKLNVKERTVNEKNFNSKTLVPLIVGIILIALSGMFMLWTMSHVSSIGNRKSKLEEKLKNLKAEVEKLENENITNSDLKKVEEKSRSMGFIENDSLKYIRLQDEKK